MRPGPDGGITMRGPTHVMAALGADSISRDTIQSENRRMKLTSTVEMLDGEPADIAYADTCRLLQELVHSSAELQ